MKECLRTIPTTDMVDSFIQTVTTISASGLKVSGKDMANWLTNQAKSIKAIGNRVDLWGRENTSQLLIFKMEIKRMIQLINEY